MIDRRRVLLNGVLLAGGAAAIAVHPAMRETSEPGSSFPIKLPGAFGPWRPLPAERVVLPQADALSDAAYSQILAQAYSDGLGPAIIVLVAYGPMQTNALQLHRPETCYPSSGFAIGEQARSDLLLDGKKVPVSWLEARRGRRVDRLLYWARVGKTFTGDIWEQRATMVKNALAGKLTDGVLIRLSVESPASEASDMRLEHFARLWVDALAADVRQLLLGAQS